jgi:hypothetical protein
MKTGDTVLPAQVRAALTHDESVLSMGWARVQRARTGRGTFLAIHVVVGVFDFLRNRSMMQKLNARSAAAGIPLELNMALRLTNERLLIFRARAHPRRVGTYLGEMARERIQSVHFPFTPSGPWPAVEVRTTDKIRFRLKVSAEAAEVLVAQLDGAG